MNVKNKQSTFDYDNLGAIIGAIIFIGIPILMLIWSSSNNASPSTDTTYDEYKSEQLLNENAEQEACIDQMERDVERYGESVIGTYDCTK